MTKLLVPRVGTPSVVVTQPLEYRHDRCAIAAVGRKGRVAKRDDRSHRSIGAECAARRTSSRDVCLYEQTRAACSLFRTASGEGGQVPNDRSKDRRVQKTQGLLHGALASLIHEKSYDAIVVKEIL